MTKFFVLGPLECRSADRPLNISGTLQRTLLATLLAAEGNLVSVESLVTELWADSPPPQWENALQAHISRLRRRIQADTGGQATQLLVRHSGYCLQTGEDAVDAKVFMRALGNARNLGAADPEAAADGLHHALSLWRGRAFALVIQGPLCRTVAQRYDTARLVALETMFDLKLRCGRHMDIIPMLSELVESPSLNERFCEQLMIALYRSGQQARALSSYFRMRDRLDEEARCRADHHLAQSVQRDPQPSPSAPPGRRSRGASRLTIAPDDLREHRCSHGRRQCCPRRSPHTDCRHGHMSAVGLDEMGGARRDDYSNVGTRSRKPSTVCSLPSLPMSATSEPATGATPSGGPSSQEKRHWS